MQRAQNDYCCVLDWTLGNASMLRLFVDLLDCFKRCINSRRGSVAKNVQDEASFTNQRRFTKTTMNNSFLDHFFYYAPNWSTSVLKFQKNLLNKCININSEKIFKIVLSNKCYRKFCSMLSIL